LYMLSQVIHATFPNEENIAIAINAPGSHV
jgi:hypothetical protein